MKIALKYGVLISLGAIAWIVVAHMFVPNPSSSVHTLGAAVFFNFLQFAGIFLGISQKAKETGSKLSFKEALKTGISISFVFALVTCLFFGVSLFFIGSRMLAAEAAPAEPMAMVAAKAFAGMFLGSIILGLIYSTIISFFVAKRRSETV
jgi:Protein of unknown function (DUF4199)